MTLKLTNTLSRKKETFKPLKGKNVKMYSCGPTVYDFAHIGNFRAYIFQDILRRYLEYSGYKVKQVMNLTDVDDKTIRGSQSMKMELEDFTKKYIDAFFEDLETLNIKKADVYPRATSYISGMVDMIERLMLKGIAYRGEDGSIYYNIRKFRGYGKLSGMRITQLKAGARVKQDQYTKEEAQDFALWKAWDFQDGNVFWETDIGKGRPGWHIECSVMSMKTLGPQFDIHTGGVDLMFPHHENEIAQSEGLTGKKFVKYWVHCEHLLVNNQKMSKSVGNFYTLRDLLNKGYTSRAIRYILLATHYRQKMNFTFAELEAAKNTVERICNFVDRLKGVKGSKGSPKLKAQIKKARSNFERAMDEDLNTPEALAAIFDFMHKINQMIDKKELSKKNAEEILEFIYEMDTVLGLLGIQAGHIDLKALQSDLFEVIKNFAPERDIKQTAEVEELMAAVLDIRASLREQKDYKSSDSLREELRTIGIIVEDAQDGPKWKLVS